MTLQIKKELFQETSHSPSLIDLVGIENAREIIDFCFIANPYYPTPEMIEQLQIHLPQLIKTYPSSNVHISLKYLSRVIGVNPANLVISNGATELITTICDHFIDTIGIPIPTFGEYVEKLHPDKVALYARSVESDYELDLDLYLDWLRENNLRTALVINPDNPTGQLHSLADMHAFLKKGSWLDLIIVDESFIDFAGESIPSLLHAAEAYTNLLIVRSMSKHCGVPGLRLGYCYSGNDDLIAKIRPTLPTWNVNTLAEFYLSLLPEYDDVYHLARRRVISDTRWLYEKVSALPNCFVYPTGANFILLRLENGMTAREVQLALLQDYKLYVRDCSNKQGMDHYHIRIASQGRDRDEKVVEALTALLQTPNKQGRRYVKRVTELDQASAPRILIPTCHHIRKERTIQYVNDVHLNMMLELEAIPLMMPALDQTAQHIRDFVEMADGLLLIEGEDIHPDRYDAPQEQREWIKEINITRDEVEIELLRLALDRDLPILTICRGSQLMNVVHGGTLYPDVHKALQSPIHHIDYDNYDGLRHGIRFVPNTWLADLYQTETFRVNSYHHQAVNQLGDGLEPLAYAEDGALEAYHDPSKPFVVGLQYHPERAVDEHQAHRDIFARFVEATKQMAQHKSLAEAA